MRESVVFGNGQNVKATPIPQGSSEILPESY